MDGSDVIRRKHRVNIMIESEEGNSVYSISARRDVHILCLEGGWIVTTAGTDENYFDSLVEAENFGREIARREHSKFFVHSEHGEILVRECYEANDAEMVV